MARITKTLHNFKIARRKNNRLLDASERAWRAADKAADIYFRVAKSGNMRRMELAALHYFNAFGIARTYQSQSDDAYA